MIRQVLPFGDGEDARGQLEDIGFFPGEHVLVMVRGFPGGDPLGVRVGHSTFALRAAEAACIEVDAPLLSQSCPRCGERPAVGAGRC